MTWSYSGDPSSSDLDALRFLIGDTDTSDQQFSDEELNYLLDQTDDNVVAAALLAIDRLLIKYSRTPDQKTGDIDIKYSQRVEQLTKARASITAGLAPVPYAGGISVSDMESVRDDTDRAGPIFALGMTDNPTYEDCSEATGGTGGVI